MTEHIWAASYDEDIRDALVLQSRVTRAIAEQIRATVNSKEQLSLAKSRTLNPDAYEAYLKGRYFWNKRTGDGLRRQSSISGTSRLIRVMRKHIPAWLIHTPSQAIGSMAYFLRWMLSLGPPQPWPRHWHWTTASARLTPHWHMPWISMAGIGPPPRQNTNRLFNSILVMPRRVSGILGISSWLEGTTMPCSS